MRAEAGSIVNLGFAGDYRLLKNCPDKKGVPASRNRLDFFFSFELLGFSWLEHIRQALCGVN